MTYTSRKEWIRALLEASREKSTREASWEEMPCTLKTQFCKRHRSKCVCIILGEVMVHTLWKGKDPVQCAESLMELLVQA